MAEATSSSCAAVTAPNRRTNRASDTDFVWKASAPESLLRPLLPSAGMRTNQGKLAYCGFQSVSGTTIRNGSRPIESRLITRAGRTFWISAPTDGSKSTSQTSPRLGVGAVDIQVPLAERLERGQGDVVAVLFFRGGGGRGEDGVPLLGRQATQLGRGPAAGIVSG